MNGSKCVMLSLYSYVFPCPRKAESSVVTSKASKVPSWDHAV